MVYLKNNQLVRSSHHCCYTFMFTKRIPKSKSFWKKLTLVHF